MEDRPRARLGLLWQSLALLVLFAAYHLVLRWLMLRRGLVLGAVGPGTSVYRLVPLVVIPATRALSLPQEPDEPAAEFTVAFRLLALQALAMEALLNTTW